MVEFVHFSCFRLIESRFPLSCYFWYCLSYQFELDSSIIVINLIMRVAIEKEKIILILELETAQKIWMVSLVACLVPWLQGNARLKLVIQLFNHSVRN